MERVFLGLLKLLCRQAELNVTNDEDAALTNMNIKHRSQVLLHLILTVLDADVPVTQALFIK